MSDLPADLPRLHVLRTWHAMWLARIDAAIATAEQTTSTSLGKSFAWAVWSARQPNEKSGRAAAGSSAPACRR
ncbi:hypothetical protein ABZ863_35370 [Saccharomonospora sp. NPDC046836]|uniref:hypothetical protein n=1 Tax=Saccharomonospora sp. NPDC046836 TaxID=3156921 RepID=UPI0033DA7115